MHLAWGCATVALAYPLLSAAARRWLKRRWSRQLLDILALRPQVSGRPPGGGELLVANHLSWVDVFVINACVPTVFVCKADVRHWPLIGWLTARTETLFLERGRGRAALETVTRMRALLASGEAPVAVFPEGTTGDGSRLLPFRGALLQSAVEPPMAVVPVALRYADGRGAARTAAHFTGEMTLVESLWRIARAPHIEVRAEFLAPVRGATRDELLRRSRAAIGARLQIHAGHRAAVAPDEAASDRPAWALSTES